MNNKNQIMKLKQTYTNLPDFLYTISNPQAMENGQIVLFNDSLAKDLNLDSQALKASGWLTGEKTPENIPTIAQAYAGHQFGQFTNLGDGRALLLGEYKDSSGHRLDIQLKGSGPTPYSRGGDGLMPLKPTLKEYIMSEAMHALNVPTTRSLAVVQSTDKVYRQIAEPRGLLTRVAASHLRVGTFQLARVKGQISDIQKLADYAIERHYPELKVDHAPYLAFFRAVVNQQARLIANWQTLGFIHGVMNTDNMAISGETLDYGPCAFMNQYDPHALFSSIDRSGRYQFGNQPGIAQWNLTRFAEALLPVIHSDEEKAVAALKYEIEQFLPNMNHYWTDLMRAKFGLTVSYDNDTAFFYEFLNILEENKFDYTNAFILLSQGQLKKHLKMTSAFDKWLLSWQSRIDREKVSMDLISERMQTTNPVIIPRHHLVEEAINQFIENHDDQPLKDLHQQLKNPFAHHSTRKEFVPEDMPNNDIITFCGT